MTHLEHLKQSIPDIASRRVLDIGAGRGEFLIDCAREKVEAVGIEYNPHKISIAKEKATAARVHIDMRQGNAELLPFSDGTFGFINMCELIEHVRHPDRVLSEAARVLTRGGLAYISVPSRFSWYDTHFHTPFVNWLPRSLSESYLHMIGKQKKHEDSVDIQRLSEMHYYTYRAFVRAIRATGLDAEDLRERKLRMRFVQRLPRAGSLALYYFLRPWYFRAFHVLVRKS